MHATQMRTTMGFNRHRYKKRFWKLCTKFDKLHKGVNHYGQMIKRIDKSNEIVACPSCGGIEDWDHVALCEHGKNKRDEWVKEL